jgi:TM2 domain-containing membrane protein YozV
VYAPQPHVLVVKSGKSAGLAAVLSFFWCGLGQIYNGEIIKGFIFIVLFVVSVLAMTILIGWLTTPALWIWGMVDAYQTSERLNREIGHA